MIIPYNSIEKDTLRRIILENIVRDTSDFEGDFQNEIDKIENKIINGEIIIVYSQSKNDVTLVPIDRFNK